MNKPKFTEKMLVRDDQHNPILSMIQTANDAIFTYIFKYFLIFFHCNSFKKLFTLGSSTVCLQYCWFRFIMWAYFSTSSPRHLSSCRQICDQLVYSSPILYQNPQKKNRKLFFVWDLAIQLVQDHWKDVRQKQ